MAVLARHGKSARGLGRKWCTCPRRLQPPGQTALPGLVLYEAGFVCGDYGWRFEAILGSPAELLEIATSIITGTGC